MKQYTDMESLMSRITYILSKERKKIVCPVKLNSFTISYGLGFYKIELLTDSKYYFDSVGDIFYKKGDTRRKQHYNIISIFAFICLTNHNLEFTARLVTDLASPCWNGCYETSQALAINVLYSQKDMVPNAQVEVGYTPFSCDPLDRKRHNPPLLYCDIKFK